MYICAGVHIVPSSETFVGMNQKFLNAAKNAVKEKVLCWPRKYDGNEKVLKF